MTSEHEEQKAVIDWATAHADQYPPLGWLYAIINGVPLAGSAKQRSRIINYMKAEGMLPGVVDLCLPAARQDKNGLYIEMKKQGGKVSEGQAEFLAYLETENYHGAVCVGAIEAVELLKWYLGIDCTCVACQIAAA